MGKPHMAMVRTDRKCNLGYGSVGVEMSEDKADQDNKKDAKKAAADAASAPKVPQVIEIEITKEIVEEVIEDLVARGELVRDPITGDIIDPEDTEAIEQAKALMDGKKKDEKKDPDTEEDEGSEES